jgi:hypothetical protein
MHQIKTDIERMGDTTAHMFASLFLLAVGRAPPENTALLLHPPKCLVADRERRVPACIPLVYLPDFKDDEQLAPASDPPPEFEAERTEVHPDVGAVEEAEKAKSEVDLEARLHEDIEKGKKRVMEEDDDEHSFCIYGEDAMEIAWRRLGKERGYDFEGMTLNEERNSASARNVKRRKLTKGDQEPTDETEIEDSDVSSCI